MNNQIDLMDGNQRRFFDLLENYPEFSQCWDARLRESRPDRVAAAERYGSTGEQVIIRCLMSIWLGRTDRDSLGVTIAEIANLSPSHRAPLVAWLAAPWWP